MKRWIGMGRIVIAVGALMLIGVGDGAAQNPASSQQKILALVNGIVISHAQLEQEARLIEAETGLDIEVEDVSATQGWDQDLLENLIDRELMLQQARSRQMRIATRTINEALQSLKNRFGRGDGFARYLGTIGMDEAQLRQHLLNGLLIRRFLQDEVLRNVRVSDAELQTYYGRYPEDFIRPVQVRARHILSAASKSRRSEALLAIEALELKLAHGANFAVLAMEHSDCPSKSRGGDLGYFTFDEVIPELAEIAFALSPGQISQIVETRFGYHLIQVVDRVPPSRLPFIQVRAKIERTLRYNKENQAVKKYLAQLRNQAAIERYPVTR